MYLAPALVLVNVAASAIQDARPSTLRMRAVSSIRPPLESLVPTLALLGHSRSFVVSIWPDLSSSTRE